MPVSFSPIPISSTTNARTAFETINETLTPLAELTNTNETVTQTAIADLAATIANLEAEIAARIAGNEALDQRLIALESESVNLDLFSSVGVAEYGATVDPVLSWSETITANITSIDINGNAIAIGASSWNAPSITDDETYTITVTDEDSAVYQASVVVDFQHRAFWGATASATLDAAGVLTLPENSLVAGRSNTVTIDATGSLYVFYAYPASYGPPSAVLAYGFGVDPVITTVNITTVAGFNGDYTVVRLPLALDDNAVLLEVI